MFLEGENSGVKGSSRVRGGRRKNGAGGPEGHTALRVHERGGCALMKGGMSGETVEEITRHN